MRSPRWRVRSLARSKHCRVSTMPSSGKSSKSGFRGLRSQLSRARSLYRAINTPLNYGQLPQGTDSNLSPIKQVIMLRVAPLLTQLQSTQTPDSESNEQTTMLKQMIPGLIPTISMVLQEISDRECLEFLLNAESALTALIDELGPYAMAAAEAAAAEENALPNPRDKQLRM